MYRTRRRPDRPTTGAASRALAHLLGFDLHPWQGELLDVAGELVVDPDSGQLVEAYSEVIVPVPRRAGKTAVALVKQLETATRRNRARGWYTAQSRADAAAAMLEDWIPDLDDSDQALRSLVEFRRSNGSEAIRVPGSSSSIAVFAPRPKAMHGRAADLVMFDEAWSFSLERGEELEIASRPPMATRPGAQSWKMSAAGDIDSTWWIELLERGREAVEADTGFGVCHVEWSADVEGLDYSDEATWMLAHPAILSRDNPTGTVPLAFLREEWERDPEQFVRLYLNITDRDGTRSSPIDLEQWQRLAAEWDRSGTVHLAIDSSEEQASTAIVAAGDIGDGYAVLELVEYREGDVWAVARVAELAEDYPLGTIAIDPASPAGALISPIRRAGFVVEELQARDASASAAQFVAAVRTGEVRHVADPVLELGVQAGRRRKMGDGAWTWRREGSPPEACALVAASHALYAATSGLTPAVS